MHTYSLRISLDTYGGHACPVEGEVISPPIILLYSLCPAEFPPCIINICRVVLGILAFPKLLISARDFAWVKGHGRSSGGALDSISKAPEPAVQSTYYKARDISGPDSALLLLQPIGNPIYYGYEPDTARL